MKEDCDHESGCKQIPGLDFHSKDLKIDLHRHNDDHARSAFDKLMVFREKRGVNSLILRWFHQNNPNQNVNKESQNVHRWLQSAVNGKIKELQLNIMLPEDKHFKLPQIIHSCKSLSSLILDLHWRVLEFFPSIVGFVSLTTLTLKDVKFVNNSFESVISMSRILKKLNLEEVLGVEEIKISSDSLKELRITKTRTYDLNRVHIEGKSLQTVSVTWTFDVATGKHLKIRAPVLEVLFWRGDTVESCDIGDLWSIVYASFDLRPPAVEVSKKMKYFLAGLIRKIDGAKRLELNCWHVEILTEDCKLNISNDLVDLVINVWDFNEEHQISAIESFLGVFPNLRYLNFMNCRQPWGIRVGELMGLEKSSYAQRSLEHMLSELESVKMELTGGTNELELAKNLIKNARNLKKMKILYSSLDISRLKEINKDISKVERTSSSAVVQCVPYV